METILSSLSLSICIFLTLFLQNEAFKGEKFDKDFLDTHNKYRAIHGTPPLQYSEELNNVAQNYANELAATDDFKHSNSPYGENLFAAKGYNSIDGAKPVDAWYAENVDYNYNTGRPNQPGKVVGHFTQVVWKSSQWLGVGIAKSQSGWIYVVANYDPPGNYQGKYKENVPPPQQ